MKIEKVKSKLKKVFNRVMGVLLPVATLLVSCDTNALVVHATETSVKNILSFYTTEINETEKYTRHIKSTIEISDGLEIVGLCPPVNDNGLRSLKLYVIKNNELDTKYLENYNALQIVDNSTGHHEVTLKGTNHWYNNLPYSGSGLWGGAQVSYGFELIEGKLKLFNSLDEIKAYASTGTGDYDIIKPDELEKGWYLKNVSYKVTADDSPSSEAGADATYIHFSWDIDNLQDGDLLEIKTKSYYKKILGEQLSGFHDFITKSDGVSAYEGKYSFSQYEATKAWFNSLENKPLAFKEYDTTDYYLRPYRQGQYGGWVHIKMGRSTPTSSPYIEDIEYGDFDDDNNWTVDEDLTDKNGGHHGVDQGGGYIPPDQSDNPFTGTNIAGIFSYFYDFMKQIPAMLGDLPALVGNIISFLPKPIIAFIGIGVLVAIILRIVGR